MAIDGVKKAIHKPSAQHVLDDDYYKRIEAIQYTMSHDDGKKIDNLDEADIILLGVSRTSKNGRKMCDTVEIRRDNSRRRVAIFKIGLDLVTACVIGCTGR